MLVLKNCSFLYLLLCDGLWLHCLDRVIRKESGRIQTVLMRGWGDWVLPLVDNVHPVPLFWSDLFARKCRDRVSFMVDDICLFPALSNLPGRKWSSKMLLLKGNLCPVPGARWHLVSCAGRCSTLCALESIFTVQIIWRFKAILGPWRSELWHSFTIAKWMTSIKVFCEVLSWLLEMI